MQIQFIFPKKPSGFNLTLVEYRVSVRHLMKNEKNGFKKFEKKGIKACLLVSKDYIKSPSVPAMSARSSRCYLLAIY